MVMLSSLLLVALVMLTGTSKSVRAQGYSQCNVAIASQSGSAGGTATITVSGLTGWSNLFLNIFWDFDQATFDRLKNAGQGENFGTTTLGAFQLDSSGSGAATFTVPDANAGPHTVSLGTPSLGGVLCEETFIVSGGRALPSTGAEFGLLAIAGGLVISGLVLNSRLVAGK